MHIRTISDALDIIVSRQEVPLVPNTGVFSLSAVGSTFFIPAAILFVVAIALFFLGKYVFKKKPYNFMPSIVLFLLSLCLAIPAASSAVDANTKLYATTRTDAPTIATASKTITLDQDYPDGYTIFAYADAPDGFTIYNEDHSASIAVTDTVTDQSSLLLNSYGIKSQTSDAIAYGPVSIDSSMPTVVATSLEQATAGSTVDIEYVVKLDTTTPDGTYSTDFSDIHFYYDVYPGRPLPVSSRNDESVDRIMALSCDAGVCKDIDNQKYVSPEGKNYYTPAFDVTIAVTPEGYGTIAPFYSAKNVPYGSGVSIDGDTITIDDATFTATPNIIPDEHTYFFEEWDLGGLTTDGIVSDMTFTASFYRTANEYAINLDAGEDATYLGSEHIYVIYDADFYSDSSAEVQMTSSANPIATPTRTGYKFSGYYTEPNGEGDMFIDKNGYITDAADSTFITKAKVDNDENVLYADWDLVEFFSITTMQEMTANICAAATTPTIVASTSDTNGAHIGDTSYIPTRTLKDSRDNEEYTVKKLADGKCWITENLRLGGSSTIDLTPDDTNIASNWTLPASSIGFAPSTSYAFASINADLKNTIQPASGFSPAGKIGNFYSFCAASAGTHCEGPVSDARNAEYDICPKGWRMPTGGDSGEYQALYTTYSNSISAFQSVLATPLSGIFYNGSALYQGQIGRFWSSTAFDGSNMYRVTTYPDNLFPTSNDGRNVSLSVRCVAR